MPTWQEREKSLVRGELLRAALADGRLRAMDVAESRRSGSVARHVQDALRDRAVEIARRLVEEGSWVYVTGHMSMGLDVRRALTEILVHRGEVADPVAARAMLEERVAALRYQTSVPGP